MEDPCRMDGSVLRGCTDVVDRGRGGKIRQVSGVGRHR